MVRPSPTEKQCKKIGQIHFKLSLSKQICHVHKKNDARETLGQQADAEGRPTATDKAAWVHCCRRDVNVAIQKPKCVSYNRRSCDTKFACHATSCPPPHSMSEHSSDYSCQSFQSKSTRDPVYIYLHLLQVDTLQILSSLSLPLET